MQIDNTLNNDTLIEELEARKSSIKIILIFILIFIYIGLSNDFGIKYSVTNNRVRCIGYIINLSTQLFLFVNQADSLKDSPLILNNIENVTTLVSRAKPRA
jgi:hypothetical protein